MRPITPNRSPLSSKPLAHKWPFPDFSLTERDHLRPPHPAIVPPPSTTTVEPVENRGDAKYNTAFATSEDSPMRRIGNRSDALANIASRSVSAMPAHNGVAISPGETAFTLIGASSRARPRASASSAALTVQNGIRRRANTAEAGVRKSWAELLGLRRPVTARRQRALCRSQSEDRRPCRRRP